jgi:hypothetical protein
VHQQYWINRRPTKQQKLYKISIIITILLQSKGAAKLEVHRLNEYIHSTYGVPRFNDLGEADEKIEAGVAPYVDISRQKRQEENVQRNEAFQECASYAECRL